MDRLDLAAVIVTFNTRDLVLQCLQSVCEDADQTERPYRLIVVDNASTDDTATAIRDAFPQAHLIENSTNVGLARALNQGLAACADARYVLLMNSDIKVLPRTLGPMMDYLDTYPHVAGVSVKLISELHHMNLYFYAKFYGPLSARIVSLLQTVELMGRLVHLRLAGKHNSPDAVAYRLALEKQRRFIENLR